MLRVAASLGDSFDRELLCAALSIDIESDGVVEPVSDRGSEGVVAQSAAGHLRAPMSTETDSEPSAPSGEMIRRSRPRFSASVKWRCW